MSGGLISRRRSRLFLAALLVAIGVVAAGPAVGASEGSEVVRVVVRLDEPSLASYRDTVPGLTGVLQARTADGHLDVTAPASQAYVAYLDAQQDEFEQQLAAAAPGAVVHWRYRIALNGL